MTSKVSRNVTYSPGSADGPAPSDSPDGPTTGLSGPAPVPVSRFRARGSEKAMPTNDTCGPLFTASSPSASLQWSLESRLHQRLAASGSPEYALTWKTWDMPAGPPICALRASARRTSDSGFSGWPTPMAGNPGKPGPEGYNAAGNTDSSRKTEALVAGWATPKARDHKGNGVSVERRQKGVADSLDYQAKTFLSGQNPSSSPAPMEKPGACPQRPAGKLNPRFSLWLMGYPAAWACCAERATPSSRSSLRNLSKRRKRRGARRRDRDREERR